jgi:hypothetical protein
MDSYWDLYVAYVNKCVRDNWINDIDPHHYEMEWNHWLPKACFPDIRVGQWLTLRQHSIASALQSLALRKNCMCGWHKKYLPNDLLGLAWPLYSEAARKRHKERDYLGRSILGVRSAEKIHAEKDEQGRSLHTLRIHANKDELGRSVLGVDNAKRLHAEKDELGRSVQGVKNAQKLNSEKDELGRSVQGVRGAERLNSQVWESTVDGFRSNSGAVACHNKRRGWDPNARIRVG